MGGKWVLFDPIVQESIRVKIVLRWGYEGALETDLGYDCAHRWILPQMHQPR